VKLNLRGNPTGTKAIQAIAKYLSSVTSGGLKLLTLCGCDLDDEMARILCNGLKDDTKLHALFFLLENDIGKSGFEAFLEALRQNGTLYKAGRIRNFPEDYRLEVAVRLRHNRVWNLLRKQEDGGDTLLAWILSHLGIENQYLLLRDKPGLFMPYCDAASTKKRKAPTHAETPPPPPCRFQRENVP